MDSSLSRTPAAPATRASPRAVEARTRAATIARAADRSRRAPPTRVADTPSAGPTRTCRGVPRPPACRAVRRHLPPASRRARPTGLSDRPFARSGRRSMRRQSAPALRPRCPAPWAPGPQAPRRAGRGRACRRAIRGRTRPSAGLPDPFRTRAAPRAAARRRRARRGRWPAPRGGECAPLRRAASR